MGDLLQDIWTPDVKANQLADFLSGIAPVRSVVNVGNGVADLVLLPLEQYRRDGRIVRGLQKGAASFSRTTALEAIRLGARLATGTQVILEQAESHLGHGAARGPATVTAEAMDEDAVAGNVSKYAQQPADVREGIQSAYRSVSDNLRSAAQTIVAVPLEVYERSSTDVRVRDAVGRADRCRARCERSCGLFRSARCSGQ